MTTVTVSLPDKVAKKITTEAKKHGFATKSAFIQSVITKHLIVEQPNDLFEFEEFVPKPLGEIRKDFDKTGKYTKKFTDSVIKGLSESSVYADKTTRF